MKKTNILFVITDDHGAWAMGCAGDKDVKTPTLDRLAQRGMRFDRFFCVSPVCSPARASIYTGKIPSCHGIHDYLQNGHLDEAVCSDELREDFDNPDAPWFINWPRSTLHGDKGIHYLAGHKTFTEVLADNGYECALTGKWHMGDSFTPQAGFSYWKTTAIGAENYFYPVVLEDGCMQLKHNCYVTDYIADNAIHFLKHRDESKPFCLCVHFTAPHAPWSHTDHPAEYIDLYKDCDFSATPLQPPHKWSKNDVHQSLSDWQATPRTNLAYAHLQTAPLLDCWEDFRRECLTGYYAALTGMDTALSRILRQLEKSGEMDNTLIVFTGDNGMSMGHHGIFGKGNGTRPVNMYDSAVMVPAIFTCPGRIPAGVVNHAMQSHYDLYETLLDFVDVPYEKTPDMPGHSFKALLTGDTAGGHGSVVIFDEYGPCRMIRTDEWKLVRRLQSGEDELYDLKNDPNEDVNRIDDPACQEIRAQLSQQMADWFARYVSEEFDGAKEKVTGHGQLTSHSFR